MKKKRSAKGKRGRRKKLNKEQGAGWKQMSLYPGVISAANHLSYSRGGQAICREAQGGYECGAARRKYHISNCLSGSQERKSWMGKAELPGNTKHTSNE